MYKKNLFLFATFLILFSINFVFAANEVINIGLNKNLYAPDEQINISGKVFDSLGTVDSANITISINNTTSSALSDSSGTFFASINAPSTEGRYNLTLSYGDASIVLEIRVSSIDEIRLAIISSASEALETLIFQSDMAVAGITDDGSITGDLLYANFSNNGTTYYAIVQKDEGETDYNTIFINNVANFTTIKFQYLIKGSKIGLNGYTYELFFIDPAGSKAFLIRSIEPVFYGEENEWAKLFILALNSSGSVLNTLTSLTLEQYNNAGELENTSNIALSRMVSGISYYGFTTQDILISESGGMHQLIIEGIQHISYFVEKFTLNIGVETQNGAKVSTAAAGEQVVLKASVIDLNSGSATGEAQVSAIVIDPNGDETTYTLSVNANKQFLANVTLDESLTGTYSVVFIAEYSDTTIKKEYRFNVKSYDLFMKAFSPGKGKGDFLPPNTYGYIIVGAKDILNEEFANLSNLTGNCANTSIYLNGIYNDKNVNSLINFSTMNLNALYTDASVSSWIQEEIENNFGSGACAIKFYTPSQSGRYKLEVAANLSDEIITIKEYVEVSSMFAYGMPADCTTGSFTESVQPGSYICFKVNAYDSATGQQIAPAAITDINIVEVYSESEGVITDQITNASLKTFSDNTKGFTFKTYNASIGPHFIKFRIKTNTTSGTGASWFMTELWKVWAYPYCSQNDMFCNFGTESDIDFKVEAFTAGFGAGKEDITVSVSSVKNFDVGDTISISSGDDSSCTTESDNSSSGQDANNTQSSGKVSPAYCVLTIPAPDEGWSSGSYEVELTATDADENSMDFYSWFRVENFRFFAWNRNWEITSSQDATFDITLQSFDNENIAADVTISKLYYMGTKDMWMSPKEISINASSQEINGSGTYILDSEDLNGLKPGFYEAVFSATSEQGTQTTRAGFSLMSFVTVTDVTGQNYERNYEKNGSLTINVSTFDSINWTTWPPTGTPHNISNISVVKIVKDGMWDSPYKARGRDGDAINESNDCDDTDNNCVLTVTLTDYDQSQYEAIIEVTDGDGATSQNSFWFTVETYSLTIPEIQDWRIISTANRLTDKIEITLSTNANCGTSSDSVTEPTNVTNCLFDEQQRLPTIANNWDNSVNNTIFLLDKTNILSPKLYINGLNETWQNGNRMHNNFTLDTTVGPLAAGNSFIDSNGYNWTISEIDAGLGKVSLQSVDGVVRSRTNQAGQGTSESTVEYLNLYIVNKSLSQSGVFLYSGSSDNEDKFWDDQWAQIDLDNDGKYNCNQTTGLCEEYIMILADVATSGVYDTLLMSPTRNMTAGINSSYGWSGAGDIRFNESAYPVYLLNLIYSESNGLGRYRLVTTTNKAGWAGRNLGVFQLGSQEVKIPVMVASPSTKLGIANKTVVIDKLRSFGSMNYQESPLEEAVIANTSANGIALLSVNMSGIQSGEYNLILQVNESGTIITSASEWENPIIEMRGFSISNLFGVKKTINDMTEWSNASNNLFRLASSEAMLGNSNELGFRCGTWNNELNDVNICHVEDWRFKELWVNLSNNSVLKDTTPTDWYLSNSDFNETRYNILDTISVTTDSGGQLNYEIVNIENNESDIQSFNLGEVRQIQKAGSTCNYLINITSINFGEQTFRVNIDEQCPWNSNDMRVANDQEMSINQAEFLGGMFNTSSISEGSVELRVFYRVLTLGSPVAGLENDLQDGNDGRIRVVSNALNSGYDLYIYNSQQRQTRDDLENRSGMLDMVAVVNSSGDVIDVNRFGQPFTGLSNQLDGKALVYANPWDYYVYLSNLTINDEYIYPLPWACDNKTFYVTEFSEEDLGTRMYDCNMENPTLSTDPNYLILFDSMCDGVWGITNARIDDDPVLDDSWIDVPNVGWIAYDYDHIEEGSYNECKGENGNSSESWVDLGRESWPVSITRYNTTTEEIDLFKSKWGVQPNENLSSLTLWVQAKNFDGTLITGNISLPRLTGRTYTCGMKQEEELSVNTSDGVLTSGMGYLDVDLSNISSSDLTFKFKVQDESDINKFENIVKQMWYGPAEMNMNDNQDCGDMFKGGEGGGGSGGFEMDEEEQAELDRCEPNNATLDCATAKCAWLTINEFGPGEPPEGGCLPCFVLDDAGEEICNSKDGCQWYPDPFQGGICNPAE